MIFCFLFKIAFFFYDSDYLYLVKGIAYYLLNHDCLYLKHNVFLDTINYDNYLFNINVWRLSISLYFCPSYYFGSLIFVICFEILNIIVTTNHNILYINVCACIKMLNWQLLNTIVILLWIKQNYFNWL